MLKQKMILATLALTIASQTAFAYNDTVSKTPRIPLPGLQSSVMSDIFSIAKQLPDLSTEQKAKALQEMRLLIEREKFILNSAEYNSGVKVYKTRFNLHVVAGVAGVIALVSGNQAIGTMYGWVGDYTTTRVPARTMLTFLGSLVVASGAIAYAEYVAAGGPEYVLTGEQVDQFEAHLNKWHENLRIAEETLKINDVQ